MTRGLTRGPVGFTLIEIVVALAIVAVSSALVLPMVGGGTDTLRLRSEAGRVAALLRQARQQAVIQRRVTRVTLDRGRNVVTVTAGDLERPVRELAMPPGVRLSVALGAEAVTFSSRGLTRETRWLIEVSGGRRLGIHVEALSGRVSVKPESRS